LHELCGGQVPEWRSLQYLLELRGRHLPGNGLHGYGERGVHGMRCELRNLQRALSDELYELRDREIPGWRSLQYLLELRGRHLPSSGLHGNGEHGVRGL
jgi:hypothetical protein